jgi:hypothetical protein
MDSMFETDGEQEATDDAMLKVFEELGLDLSVGIGAAKAGCANVTNGDIADDLDARLNRLRPSSAPAGGHVP